MNRLWIGALALTGMLVVVMGPTGCNKQTTEAPGGEKLSLYEPSNQSVTQGKIDPIDIKIGREKFNEPVTIEFKNLPAGVKVQESDMTIPKDKDKTTFNLKADDNAAPVTDQVVTVVASGPKSLKAERTFKLTVKDKSK